MAEIRLDELQKSPQLSAAAMAMQPSVRLDDLHDATNLVGVSQKDFDLPGAVFSDQEMEALRKKGKIGYFENAQRMDLTGAIPFAGAFMEAGSAITANQAMRRLQKDSYGADEALKEKDAQRVQEYFRFKAEQQVRGVTWGGQVIEGVAQLPAFMLEMLASSPLTGAVGATAIGARLTAKAATKGAGAVAAKGALWATRGAVRTATVGAPHIAARSFQNENDMNLIPTDKGLMLSKQAETAPASSIMKAIGATYLDYFTEEAGDVIFNPALTRLAGSKVVAPLMKRMADVYSKTPGNKGVATMFKKAGWDGMVSELGEEVLAKELSAALGIEDFGAKDGNALDRMIAAIPDGDEMAVMMGVLAVPGLTKVAGSQVANAVDAYRERKRAAGLQPADQTYTQKLTGSLASQLEGQNFDVVETTVQEASKPIPQMELTKEQMGDLKTPARQAINVVDPSKPVPERAIPPEIANSKEFKQGDDIMKAELLAKGRLADLDTQREDIESRMGNLEVEIANLNKIDRPDVVILSGKKQELFTLSKQLMSIHAQIADTLDAVPEDLQKENVLLPGADLEKLRQAARGVSERMERSRVESVWRNKKAQAEERRTALVKYLQARLPGGENAGLRDKYLLRAAKDMTEKELQDMLKDIESKRNSVRAKQLKEVVKSLIEKMTTAIADGHKQGRFGDPHLQRVADAVIRIVNMSREEADQTLRQKMTEISRLNEQGEGETDAAEQLKFEIGLITKVSAYSLRNADELEDAIRTLGNVYQTLLTGKDTVKAIRDAQRKAEVAAVAAEISGSHKEPKNIWEKMLKAGYTATTAIFSYNTFHLAEYWRELGGGSASQQVKKLVLSALERVPAYRNAYQQKMMRPVRAAMERIYGLGQKNDKKFYDFLVLKTHLDKTDNPENAPFLRKTVLNNGTTKDFKMSRWDVMYWYALAYQAEGEIDSEAMEILSGENQLASIREEVEGSTGGSEEAFVSDFLSQSEKSLDKTGARLTDKYFYHVSPTEQVGGLKSGAYGIEDKPVVWLSKGVPAKTDGFLYAVDPEKVKSIRSAKNTDRYSVHEGDIPQDAIIPLGKVTKDEPLTYKSLGDKVSRALYKRMGGATEDQIEQIIADRAAKEIKGNAIPSDVLSDMFSMLTENDKRFAMEMRKIFSSFWPMINPVFSRATGADMTRIENYIPWLRNASKSVNVEDLVNEMDIVDSAITPFPGSTKERRRSSSAPFAQVGLMEVFHGFQNTMSNWLATRDITARIYRYINNPMIREAINKATDGVYDKSRDQWRDGAYIKNMVYHLRGIASQGRSDNNIDMPMMALLRRNWSRVVLIKPKQFVVQLSSIAAATVKIGHLDTLKGIASFFTDPKGANDLLSKAMSLHNRHSNILVEMKEVQDLIRGDKQRFADKINFLDKYGFMFTQMGDRAAILVGGWAVFKTTYEKTKSLDQAYKEFDDFVFNLQQSAIREHQTSATVGPYRYFTQFVSAVAQYGRAYYRAYADAIRDPNPKNLKAWARTMMAFHVYIPAALWMVSNAFVPPPEDGDPEEEAEKKKKELAYMMATGPFSGLWIVGHAADFLAEAITKHQGFKEGVPVIEQMTRTRTQLNAALRKAMEEDPDPEEVHDAIWKAGKSAIGLTVGVPGEISNSVQALYQHSMGGWNVSDTPGLLYGHSVEMLNYNRRGK